MRKSIFQILEENFDFQKEIKRIDNIFSRKLFSVYGVSEDFTAEQLVSKFMFLDWKQRKQHRCISLDDMKNSLEINLGLLIYVKPNLNQVLIYLEYVQNILKLALRCMQRSNGAVEVHSDCTMLQENINVFLDHINHECHYFEDEEMVLICEKSSQATAVADIVAPEVAMKVIKYNHYLLKGDIDAKKDIILTLAGELEPKRAELEAINNNKKFAPNLFAMFNNMNLRHNNIDKTSKDYTEVVAKMPAEELEKWYDEIYQMELLAFLLLDNVEREQKIEQLKANF